MHPFLFLMLKMLYNCDIIKPIMESYANFTLREGETYETQLKRFLEIQECN